jgi:DNA uptake protein ComE-like DNA-binding protein
MLILPKPSPYPHRERAAILFVALWALVVLSILAVGIGSRVASEINLARYLEERLISLYLAKAAVNQAIIEFKKDKTLDYDTLYELQKKREATLGKGVFESKLSDEEGLININTASQSTIEQLPGLNYELAEAIIKSRNSPNPPFQLKEELLLVEGITAEIFSGFKDLITVYSEGRVNINTAGAPVFSILGMSDDLIEIILNYRKGKDGEEATEDDGEFKSVATIHTDLTDFTILTDPQERQMIELLTSNLLGVDAKNLRLNIKTKVFSNPMKDYTVILERTTGKIRFWQER